MLQPANLFEDFVELAARATIIRRDDENKPITDGPGLVRLAGYKSWRRSSDPHVYPHPPHTPVLLLSASLTL